jgi:ATP-binding cassette subfamily B protein
MKVSYDQYRSILVEQLGPQKGRVILLGVLMFANIGAQLVNPQIIRHFIDLTQTTAPLRQLMNAAGGFMLIAILQQTLETVATYLSETVSWTSTNSLRAKLVRHCLGLDMSFHNDHTPGEMIERVTTGT